jgi:hypothetical protein
MKLFNLFTMATLFALSLNAHSEESREHAQLEDEVSTKTEAIDQFVQLCETIDKSTFVGLDKVRFTGKTGSVGISGDCVFNSASK